MDRYIDTHILLNNNLANTHYPHHKRRSVAKKKQKSTHLFDVNNEANPHMLVPVPCQL